MNYVIKSGDTLSKLAATYGTTVQAIAKANPSITNLDLIKVGQQIVLPTSTQLSPSVVKAGFDFKSLLQDKRKLLIGVIGLAALAAFLIQKKK